MTNKGKNDALDRNNVLPSTNFLCDFTMPNKKKQNLHIFTPKFLNQHKHAYSKRKIITCPTYTYLHVMGKDTEYDYQHRIPKKT